jgi:hypothetical protein
MNMRVLKPTAILTVVLLLLPSSLASQPGGGIDKSSAEQPLDPLPCTDWSLASDFRLWPDQENPNRDSCGNLGVWHFMSSDLSRQTYTLLPTFYPHVCGVVGIVRWVGTWLENPPDNFLPTVAINGTGEDHQDCGWGNWPANAVNMHPSPVEDAVVGWRSPVDGHVEVSGSVADFDNGGWNGILWYIDKNTQNLAWGDIPEGGTQDFRDGAGGDLLADIPVSQNDMLYFAIDPNGDYTYDSTRVNIYIHLLPYSVSGTVTDADSAPMPDVLISANDAPTTTTDLNGIYALSVYAGTYTVTAALEGYTFDPVMRTVGVPPDATGQDFVGTLLTYSISGQVTGPGDNPMPGVTISATGGYSATTGASGAYTLTDLLPGTYTLTPTLEGYSFDPVTRSVEVPPDATGQDFQAAGRFRVYLPLVVRNQ